MLNNKLLVRFYTYMSRVGITGSQIMWTAFFVGLFLRHFACPS